ncbi:MAG TPA: DUF4332 domain-containing protein [Candidatus Thermoplasmatota archaeon]|nr:DUF4332 domain-containing protein [Candidatus Thermoplasmatota archaeon]
MPSDTEDSRPGEVEFESLGTSEAPPRNPALQMVEQHGKLRRLLFEGDHLAAPPSPVPATEPANDPPGLAADEHLPVPDLPEPQGHTASPAPSSGSGVAINSIHAEVDRLGSKVASRPTIANTTPIGSRVSSSILYRTRTGDVTETRMSDGQRERRLLYVTKRDGFGHEHAERFRPELVDAIVKDVRLDDQPTSGHDRGARAGEASAATLAEAPSSAGHEPDYRYVRAVIADEEPWEPTRHSTQELAPLRESARLQIDAIPSPAPVRAKRAVKPRKPARAPKPVAKRPAKRPRRRTGFISYPGDDHEVVEVEGIGVVYAKRLQKAGVYTTHRLCYEDAASLARRVKVPAKTIRSWQAQAELAKVKGIGKQFAEALSRSGIAGIDELKARAPDAIARQVQSYLGSLDANVLGTGVTPRRVRTWQKAARTLRKRTLPVPPKGPPEFETIRGHVRRLKQRQKE